MATNEIRASGIRGVQFFNWARTFGCRPELFFAPKTEDEVIKIINLAREEKKKIRVVGNGHSPSDIACTTDFMISLQHMNKVLEVNEESSMIKVQAGVTLQELNEKHLPKYGLALPVLGAVSDVTLGGVVNTGTHGTGGNYGTMSTYVVELELLTSSGQKIQCSREENKEIFLAAACGLGAMGILITITYQCEPAFHLEKHQFTSTLREVIEHLNLHIKSSEHFRFIWFPHTDSVVIWHSNRTNKPITKVTKLQRCISWFWNYCIGYYALEFLYWLSTFFPSMVPTINYVFYNLLFTENKEVVGESYKIFNFECLFKQHVNEWAIPRDQTGSVLWKLQEWLDKTSDVYAHFPVEVRFVKKDDLYISPSYGQDTTYINIIMYKPYNKDIPYQQYWAAYEEIMRIAGGRPHWAKAHSATATELRQMYPHFDTWCHARQRIDPIDMFINSYLDRMLNH
ncbi:L-gulonolactone oxidase-like isoform X2 [Tachypleus tridentatus]|uniref:L-gulonolactone oxidase-like isoform X2 n=2 Tax=Tachypleus tridentatus TaxID=6853 RepID=UPI003FD330E6